MATVARSKCDTDERPSVIWEAFPGDGAVSVGADHVHDPTLVHIGAKYFIFHTDRQFGLIRSSFDLQTWKTEGAILPDMPEWIQQRYSHRSAWAPDVVVLGDKLRVYYCCSNFGTNKSLIGLAECERFDPQRPLHGWVDRGLVLESKTTDFYNAIDAEVLVDPCGRHWMFFGSYWSGIHVVELDPATGLVLDPKLVCVARNTEVGHCPIEGAAACYRGGYYYLIVSYGLAAQGIGSTYRIMVGRSTSPTGPFLDAHGRSMVEGGHVSLLKGSAPMYSPGHCDVMQDHDGRWLMPYHFYDGRHHWHGDVWGRPTLQIRELLWSDDGWPLPGLPVEMPLPTQANGVAGRWLHQVDFAQTKLIELSPSPSERGQGEGTTNPLAQGEREVEIEGQKLKLLFAYGDRYYVGRNDAGKVVRGYRVED